MIYGNHPIEVSLPNEDLWLYNASTLTLRLGRENRANPIAGMDRMTRAWSRAAQQQASPSYAAPQEEDEVNSMHMETPHHSRTSSIVCTARPRGRGRHQPPSEMETLISDMENINIGQQTTLQLMQENLDMAQSLQAKNEYRWDHQKNIYFLFSFYIFFMCVILPMEMMMKLLVNVSQVLAYNLVLL